MFFYQVDEAEGAASVALYELGAAMQKAWANYCAMPTTEALVAYSAACDVYEAAEAAFDAEFKN